MLDFPSTKLVERSTRTLRYCGVGEYPQNLKLFCSWRSQKPDSKGACHQDSNTAFLKVHLSSEVRQALGWVPSAASLTASVASDANILP